MKTTRRTFLSGAAVASLPVTAVSAPAEKPFDLQEWLDTNAPADVARYHAARLAEVMNKIRPDMEYRFKLDQKAGYVFIVGDLKHRVYFRDGSPLLADDVTGTTAFADWEAGQ